MMRNKLDALGRIVKGLIASKNDATRIAHLFKNQRVKTYLSENQMLNKIYQSGDEKTKLVIASVLAIGEGPILFRGKKKKKLSNMLLKTLWDVEIFYKELGGIVGYHYEVLKLISESEEQERNDGQEDRYLKPVGIDISTQRSELNTYIRWGIEHLSEMAEVYPVGGAGDRLDLRDEQTGEALPAAELNFSGRSLLSSLIRDLEAKEYLYYKLKGKQLRTPIAMMTSLEKNNHQHILAICKRNHWFHRPQKNFKLFIQPVVPVITVEGHWAVSDTGELLLKPGGHGVIWKLAKDNKVFRWLYQRRRKKALLRQINNPIAGTDSVVLAFCGIGCKGERTFGFASCPRLLNTAQGMVVLKEKRLNSKFEYCVSNIEYTDFSKKGIEDKPDAPGSVHSRFPANTNILFAHLKAIEEAVGLCPVPGKIANFKNTVPFLDLDGKVRQVKGGRLESTMQNIADCIIERSKHPLSEKELLKSGTYVTYSDQRKTISVTKNAFELGKSLRETPQGCFYDILQNNWELLKVHCGVSLPPLCDEESYMKDGPNILFLYHPALGPLYTIICQKIRGGKMAEGSEIQLEISEIEIVNLRLKGSLLVDAGNPLGHITSEGELKYSRQCGKCVLNNVEVINSGIDRNHANVFWMNKIKRSQQLHIRLHGNAEFYAQDITFNGNQIIDVPNGFRWTAIQSGKNIVFQKEKISRPTWYWKYTFLKDDSVFLSIHKQPQESDFWL